jgi:FMN phosphatase YigB (HAD superfamily)
MLEANLLRARSGSSFSAVLDDRRVEELDAALRSPGVSILSLDCFDALLWRRVPKPIDAFLVLGEEPRRRGALANRISANRISVSTFARLRVAAEIAARQRKQREVGTAEADLREIYAELPRSFISLEVDELREIEVNLERRLTLADHMLATWLSERAATLDLRVAVVSDIYFNADEIRLLIDRPELADLADAEIITSSDIGIGKEQGLWNLLPSRWGVPPEAIVHVGNNAAADVSIPRSAGITAVYWSEVSRRLPAILEKEHCWPPANRPAGHGPDDDRGLTALRSRATFSGTSPSPDDEVAWETGTSVLGPVLVGYSDWVKERTAQLGITHALCLMREGLFLKDVIEGNTVAGANPDLRCELLWASREAIPRASIVEANAHELASFFSRMAIPSLAGAAATLGIELSRLPSFAQLNARAPHLVDNPNLLRTVLETVLADPELVETVREAGRRKRANFVQHLRETLGGARGDGALIDIGLTGGNQERLQEIIDAEGVGVRLHGFYLMADACPDDRLLREHLIDGFITSPGDSGPGAPLGLYRNRLILGLLLLSDHRTTLEIDDRGAPVCASYVSPERMRAQRQAVHDGIPAYQRHVERYRRACDSGAVGAVDGVVSRRIIERFVSEPTTEEAFTFGPWEAEDDFNNLEISPLVPAENDRFVRRLTATQLSELGGDRVIWAAGAAALWEGTIVASPNRLSQAGLLRVELDRLGGAPASGATPMWLARDGVSVASWTGDGSNISRVKVFPAVTDGLFRLDSLELVVRTATSGWRSIAWAWGANDDHARLETSARRSDFSAREQRNLGDDARNVH